MGPTFFYDGFLSGVLVPKGHSGWWASAEHLPAELPHGNQRLQSRSILRWLGELLPSAHLSLVPWLPCLAKCPGLGVSPVSVSKVMLWADME